MDIKSFKIVNQWGEEIEIAPSGRCIYPLVEFTEDFLNNICEKG